MNALIECPGRPAYAECIKIAAENTDAVQAFRGASILITGASGMVGGALCRTLLYLNRTENLGLRLLCPVRSDKSLQNLQGIAGRDEVSVQTAYLADMAGLPDKIDYIVHCASPTASAELKDRSADSLRSICLDTFGVLELARKKQPKAMVYLSSMEVYGAIDGLADEDRLGFLDLSSPRSCYPVGKRMSEAACACYAQQYGLNACTARLSQVIGAGIKPTESRAYACFAKAALSKQDIVLKTPGISRGNYVHISDAVRAILFLLTHGKAGKTYNVCGDGCSCTINELARNISKLLSDGESRVVHELPKDASSLPYAPPTGLIMDSSRLKQSGFRYLFTLSDMILSLGKDLSDLNDSSRKEHGE